MKTIETKGTITPDRRLSLQIQVPPEISPGEHRIVLMVDEQSVDQLSLAQDFPVDSYGSWPTHLSLSREDLYSEHGR